MEPVLVRLTRAERLGADLLPAKRRASPAGAHVCRCSTESQTFVLLGRPGSQIASLEIEIWPQAVAQPAPTQGNITPLQRSYPAVGDRHNDSFQSRNDPVVDLRSS